MIKLIKIKNSKLLTELKNKFADYNEELFLSDLLKGKLDKVLINDFFKKNIIVYDKKSLKDYLEELMNSILNIFLFNKEDLLFNRLKKISEIIKINKVLIEKFVYK